MSELLSVVNFDLPNITAISYLNANVAAGAGNADLINPAGFGSNVFYVFDSDQQAELFKVTGLSGATATIQGTFLYAHKKNDIVRQLFGDKFQVWRAADPGTGTNMPPSDSAFAQIGSDTAIVPSLFATQFLDPTGGSGYWYKFLYLNSISSQHTDLADSEAIRGGGYGHLVSLSQIIIEAGILDQTTLDPQDVSHRRDAAEDEIRGRLVSAGYTMPLQTNLGVSYTPPILSDIARKLAAGLLLQQNFGTTRIGSSKNGSEKIEEARRLLAEIQLNDLILVDPSGQMLAKPILLDGYPDGTNTTTDPDGNKTTGGIFSMSKVF